MDRKILYVTGTRADFGLMRSALKAIDRDERLSLGVFVTGSHLSQRSGATAGDIEESGLRIVARAHLPEGDDDGLQMAAGAAVVTRGVAETIRLEKPDVLLVLGDRFEMLAAAMAGLLTNTPIAHVHGGDRSGTVDESLRHAITKLSHIHLATHECSAARIRALGEDPTNVHVVGAPGLIDIADFEPISRENLLVPLELDPSRPFLVLLFHPVVQDIADSASQSPRQQVEALIGAVEDVRGARGDIQVLGLLPNTDAGNRPIREALEAFGHADGVALTAHLSRNAYLSAMASAAALVGNSSSGIIEAGSFGLPVVNIGDRQFGRERNPNVFDVPAERGAIAEALASAIGGARPKAENIYRQADTAGRIVEILATTSLSGDLLKKSLPDSFGSTA